jgi:tetratricopeptide (TPR) repeat protein
MYFDFNGNRADLKIPLADAILWEDKLPNISTTSLPIDFIKSNYFIQEKMYEEAKSLIKKGNKVNPHLGMGEYNLARIYREQKMLDSAYHFAKIAVEKLPRNIGHISYLQKILAGRNDLKEAKILFQKFKHLKDKIIWNNHALFLIALNEDGKFIYGEDEIDFANEAYELFPEEKFIKAAHKIVNSGHKSALEGDSYDKLANEYFKEKKYEKAILNWEKAIELINNEDSYYLNIAQAYQSLGNFEKSIEYLKKLEKLGIKGFDGKFEFLTSLAFFKLGKKDVSCNYARQAKEYNYENANDLIKITCN